MDQQPDQTIDQVRELLFGAAERDLKDRHAAMDTAMREAEMRLSARIDEQFQQLDAARREADEARRASLREIGAELAALGARIQALGEPQDEGQDARQEDTGDSNVHHLDGTHG